ncbi:MAG TPA: ABC transporter ATP-binding protein [Streptosporangiaceae bacterium]|nr:ABC transporter ATP-binding protein [Streptosporangiaceae bacterium]
MIGLEAVRVRYGATVALDGVTERAADGEWLGLIGPNGAGKTTLLQAVARQVRFDGRVEVGGQPTAGLSRRALARLVAYVPQRPQLPPDMTVGDYVLLGRTPHIGYLRVETDDDRQISAELIGRLGLTELAGRALRTLSGGELQRLVLARALAQQAPVLLLDEPTSALDLGRRVDALELVDTLRRERSLTVLSAVHDLTLAGQFADRLLLLDDGRVAASGPPPGVLRDEVLRPHFGQGVEVLTTARGERAVISRRHQDVPPSRLGSRPARPGRAAEPGRPGVRPLGAFRATRWHAGRPRRHA